MNIRFATEQDIDRMYRISLAAHTHGYDVLIPKKRWKDFLERFSDTEENRQKFYKRALSRIENPRWRVWVAEVSGKIVGYTYAERINENYVYKRGIFVEPQSQGMGVGRALFDISLTIIKSGKVRLTVIKNNEKARTMYKAHGFVDTAIPERSFFDAEQVVMEFHKA